MLPPLAVRCRVVVRVNDWILSRTDGVPDALARAVDRRLPRKPGEGGLVSLAAESLDQAERESVEGGATPSGHRHGRHGRAESLLVADALITYACEEALRHEDPDRVWAELLARIGTAPE